MIRGFVLVCILLPPATATAQQNAAPAPVVFFTVSGPDGPRLQRFYADLFAWPLAPDGSVTTGGTSPLSGQIAQTAKELAETVIYIGVPDVTAALARVQANGGTIEYPRFEVPGRVILGVFKDPAGNRVGLVEIEDGRAKVPGGR